MAGPLVIKLPGKPMAEGRPRSTIIKPKGRAPFVSTYPDPKSKTWRTWAKSEFLRALEVAGIEPPAFAEGPLQLSIDAYWPLPKSLSRKRQPVPLRRKWNGPDWDNIAKAVCDAGNEVLWSDDNQVAVGVVRKYTAAQGDAPCVLVTVMELPEEP